MTGVGRGIAGARRLMLVGWETAANPTGCGHHGSRAHPSIAPCLVSCRAGRRSLAVVAGNKGAGGPFAPIVVVTRNAMGTKEFNQFRGKAISLHSQGGKALGPAPAGWAGRGAASGGGGGGGSGGGGRPAHSTTTGGRLARRRVGRPMLAIRLHAPSSPSSHPPPALLQ